MLLQKCAQHPNGCPKTGRHRAGERQEQWVVEDSIGCTALEGWEGQGRVLLVFLTLLSLQGGGLRNINKAFAALLLQGTALGPLLHASNTQLQSQLMGLVTQ